MKLMFGAYKKNNKEEEKMSTVKTDAQFMERFENFAFKEVVEEESVALETNTRYLAILASLVGTRDWMPISLF